MVGGKSKKLNKKLSSLRMALQEESSKGWLQREQEPNRPLASVVSPERNQKNRTTTPMLTQVMKVQMRALVLIRSPQPTGWFKGMETNSKKKLTLPKRSNLRFTQSSMMKTPRSITLTGRIQKWRWWWQVRWLTSSSKMSKSATCIDKNRKMQNKFVSRKRSAQCSLKKESHSREKSQRKMLTSTICCQIIWRKRRIHTWRTTKFWCRTSLVELTENARHRRLNNCWLMSKQTRSRCSHLKSSWK